MKRFLALAIAALMIFSCAACSSDGNGDTTAAEGTAAADTVSDVIAAPANDDTTAPSETAAPAENGGNTASPAPSDRNNNINIKPAGTAKPSAGGSSTVTPPKTDNTPVEVETAPKKIIVSAEKEWIFTEKLRIPATPPPFCLLMTAQLSQRGSAARPKRRTTSTSTPRCAPRKTAGASL